MALTSPGVQVTIIDESNYLPAATNSVPYIMVATAQNKISGTGTGVAAGTLAVNANKTYLITSQRDLAATFGVPFFYKTSAGTPINGYELNEYGLLAAYSALGVTNRVYIQRADIDLSELTASLSRPVGAPVNNTYWLDTANSLWGIFEWSLTTNAFTNKVPLVITSTADLESGTTAPSQSFGSIGDYAVNTTDVANPTYYKNSSNLWVLIGSDDWKSSWPTVQGTAAPGPLTAASTIRINGTEVAVPAAASNTVSGLANAINAAAITGVTASNSNGKLEIQGNSTSTSDGSTADGGIITIEAGSVGGAALLTQLGITARSYYVPRLQQSYSYTIPRWRSTDAEPTATGSVWNKINSVNLGTNLTVSKYSSILASFIEQTCAVYQNDQSANKTLDPSGGGKNIAAGTTYAQYNVSPEFVSSTSSYNNTFTLQLFERKSTGATVILGDDSTPTFTSGDQFTISASVANSTTLSTPVTATVAGTTASDFVSAVSQAAVPYVSATITSSGAISFTHSQGGVIVLAEVGADTAVSDAGFNDTVDGVRLDTDGTSLILSNWVTFDYTASLTSPNTAPPDGRYWYYSAVDQVDIMINNNGAWLGYKNVTSDVRGYNLTLTNATGPQISPTAPTTQNDTALSPLVYGDLWVDTSNLEAYPILKRWEIVDGVDQWTTIDDSDQTTENGVLFADARWATNDTTNPITDDIPTIVSLLTSNYLDIDAPSPSLYPDGMLLWNTRRNGFNVKSYQVDYFNAASFPDDILPDVTNAWVTASGNKNDGSPYMGRQAVRSLVVAALKSGLDTSQAAREEQNVYNLITTPGYPELMTNMVALNNERNNTAFVIADTPLRLGPDGTELITWATNNNGLGTDTGDGLTTGSQYMGVFYPSCQTTDLSGSPVVQPPSHMMLRTILRSDNVSFPWLAPAGVRRGVIDNADAIGYINATTGEFVQIGVRQGVRDILYENKINPITFIPGIGITNYGNKTVTGITSALDRINVARLIAFIRGRLQEIGTNFLFEPNDQVTRDEMKNNCESLMIDLIAKRGIYDYLVVCDLSNNTPARIDRNELYVDIAIEPVKAVEFIYIPVRIKNTGEIAGGQTASSSAV